ncbi:MAG: PDZ domain-containing protein, partial [Lacipirellulaceae bacterium]
MDRRFILWLSVSLLLILLLGKRPELPQPDDKEKQAANQLAEDGAGEGVQDAGEKPAEGEDAAGDNAEKPQPKQEPEVEVAAQKLTLGTVDESSDYRMLVTLTNEGAAVERIELANPKYLDLTDRGGYLGHLALASAQQGEGLKVQVVGAGTPAAEAGIQIGDLLLAAGVKEAKPIESVEAFNKLLAKTKPGRELSLTLERDGVEQQVTAKLVRRPLEVIRPEKENVLLWADKLPAGSRSPPSFQMTLEQIDRRTLTGENEKRAENELPKLSEFAELELRKAPWEISEPSQDSVTFRKRSSQLGLTFVKRYRLEETPEGMQTSADYPAYHLTLELAIENTGSEAKEIAYQLDGPNGLPIEGWWYAYKIGHDWGAVGLRDVMSRTFDAKVQQFAP